MVLSRLCDIPHRNLGGCWDFRDIDHTKVYNSWHQSLGRSKDNNPNVVVLYSLLASPLITWGGLLDRRTEVDLCWFPVAGEVTRHQAHRSGLRYVLRHPHPEIGVLVGMSSIPI